MRRAHVVSLLRALLVSVVAVALLGGAGCPDKKPGPRPDSGAGASGRKAQLSVFFTGDLRGEIEPCGCTSDPLGDLARFAALMEDARKERPTLWLDAGSLLFSEAPLAGGKADQERLRADLIVEHTEKLGLGASALGVYDLGDGKVGVRPARLASNVPAQSGLPVGGAKLLEAGGVKVGVFGLSDPEALARFEVKAGEPAAAAAAAVKELRGQGAQVVVALTQLDRKEAQELARAVPGMDFVIAGGEAPEPIIGKPAPSGVDKVGDTYVLQMMRRGQSVIRVDLGVDAAGGGFVDAMGEARAQERLAAIDENVAGLEADLKKWAADPSADQAFLARKQAEVDALKAEKAELQRSPSRRPAKGNWFEAAHILIKKRLRCDKQVVAAKRAFDMAAGQKNLEAARSEAPIPVPKGQPVYVGVEECAGCHDEAIAHWEKTSHARAYPTLEKLGKTLNRDCVSCHVTGWMKPGGATLAASESLRNVQCETCHGPASKHVNSGGKDMTGIVRAPAQELCVVCHSPEHSDTFDFDPYLRDVTGPGHGAERHQALGEGPTGRALRKAALEKAGAGIGEGCDK